MSTKTSIKRIALVAVSALGFGLLSVQPSIGATAQNDTLYLIKATITNSNLIHAARVGQEVSIPITATWTADAGSAATDNAALSIAAAITSQPATSSKYITITSGSTAPSSGLDKASYGLIYSGSTVANAWASSQEGSATSVATVNYIVDNNATDSGAGTNSTVGIVKFTPTATGVYTVVVWNENTRTAPAATGANAVFTATSQAALSGVESSKTFTINVSSGVSSITLTKRNTTAPTKTGVYGAHGALIKVELKDAAGNLAALAPGETVTLTPSGSGLIEEINNAAATGAVAGTAYNVAASSFVNGVAWVNVTNTVAEDVSLTASIAGGAQASTSLSYKAITAVASGRVPYPYQATRTAYIAVSSNATSIPYGTTTTTFRAVGAGSAVYVNFSVAEETCDATGVGAINGATVNLTYDVAALGSATTGIASTSVTASCTRASSTEALYTVSAIPGTAGNDNVASIAARSGGSLTADPVLINAVAASSNTVKLTLVDNFGAAYPYQTISATVAGKNPVTTARTAVTDVAGQVSFTFTDANTNTAVSDVASFTGPDSTSASTTITYGANTVAKVTLSYPNEDDVVAGTTFTEISAAGAGATGTSASVTAVVTGSTGALLAGVPVTFAVSGLTGAEVHTTLVTVYTDAAGEATTAISSYAAGKATVTATAGGLSSSADIYFKQTGATEARTIAATVSGNVVTATVKDRYGNTIEGVVVNATRTGTGYFGSGASTATGNTDKNGQVEFIFTGTGTVTVAFSAADYGQSADAAGEVAGVAVTAAAAGTTVTNQTGLGAALAPAGVNSASVSVASTDAAAAAAEAAADAAAEAIDAANAATDAANLAAEAADAATVAAEEARDAADAATAAVEELATQVATLMAALKAQITTLANTVAKIAKKVKA